MAMSTSSKEAAAEAIMQFRTIEGIGNISCTEVTKETDENGVSTHSFEVNVMYNPFVILGQDRENQGETSDSENAGNASSDDELEADINSVN